MTDLRATIPADGSSHRVSMIVTPQPCGCIVQTTTIDGQDPTYVLATACPDHGWVPRPGDVSVTPGAFSMRSCCATYSDTSHSLTCPTRWAYQPASKPVKRLAVNFTGPAERAYPDVIRAYVDRAMRAVHASEDVVMVWVLARNPWLLHHLAATPEWATYKAAFRAQPR